MSVPSAMSSEAMVVVSRLAGHPILLYLHASGAALLLVDWLSTIDVEITYAWRGPWNMGRAFYFLTRYPVILGTPGWLYFNMAFAIPPSLCERIFTGCSVTSLSGIVFAEVIMTIRVHALWGRRRGVGILLFIITGIEIVASVVFFNVLHTPLYYFSLPNVPGCLSYSLDFTKSHSWPYVPLVVHQTLIFLLTAIKGIEHYRNDVYGTSLINTFYQDGVIYYALLVAFSAANIAATRERSDMYILYFLTFLQQVIHSILSARMLLHLRQESAFHIDSEKITSLKFTSTDGSAVSTSDSALTTWGQIPERPDIPNHGWFGQEESPAHRSQTSRSREDQV